MRGYFEMCRQKGINPLFAMAEATANWGDLWDQADAVSNHSLKGIEFLEKVGNFVKERASIEEEYAAKLRALAKKSQGKKKEDEDAKAFTYVRSFNNLLREVESLAAQHEVIAERLKKEVVPFVTMQSNTHRQSRKQCLGDLQQIHQNLNASIEHHFKQQKSYGKTFKEAEAAYLKYYKAEKNMEISRLDLEKAKNNAQSRNYSCEQAKQAYASALDSANEAQRVHYTTLLPQVLEKMRLVDEERIKDTRQAMDLSVSIEVEVTPIISRCHQDMKGAISQICETRDSATVVESFRTGYKHPLPFPFEDLGRPEEILTAGPNGEPGDATLKRGMLGAPKKDGGKSVTRKQSMHQKIFGGGEKKTNDSDYGTLPPQQRARKLQEKISELEGAMRKSAQAHDGLQRMQSTYKENPRLGNPSDCDAQIAQYAKEIDALQQQISKLTLLLNSANREMGGGDSTPISMRSLDSTAHSVHSGHSFEPPPRPNPPASQSSQRTSYSEESVSSEGSRTNGHAPTCREEVYEEPALGTCVALFPFEGSTDGTMKLAEGEEYLLLEKDEGDGWTRVRKIDGAFEGFVPTSYLKCKYYPE
ncbi:unnamed protein product, partial [Mesorhabditis belari]|uniref:Formin-binding protein 1-like n=1 Tax=Mesorhabditis belari TaxID=2138241 RepID=A0AAF3FKM1_9BILA